MNYFNRIAILSAVIALATLNYSCSVESQSKDVAGDDSTAAIPVEAARAVKGTISAHYSSTATLEAENEAMVVAKVRGVVREMLVEEGDFVQPGTVLARLEDEQLEIEAQRAKATMDRLYNDYQRNRELFEQNLISADQYENSKFEYESQKAAYELTRLKIEHSSIKAPIGGVISQRLVKTGNMVNADQQMFKITDFDPMLAVLHIPEHELSTLEKGQTTLIQADAVSGQAFTGRVLRISPVVNPETGTFKVTVAVQDPSGKLKPGMFTRVRIVYDTHENTLLVPKAAVMEEDGVSSVYLVSDKMAYRRTITTGYVNGNNIEVLSGLMEGDTIVTIGQSSLQDSTLVEVVELL